MDASTQAGKAVMTSLPVPDRTVVDMARRTLAARGESIRLVPGWRDAPLVVLPGPDARIAPTTFDAWLAGAGVSGSGPR